MEKCCPKCNKEKGIHCNFCNIDKSPLTEHKVKINEMKRKSDSSELYDEHRDNKSPEGAQLQTKRCKEQSTDLNGVFSESLTISRKESILEEKQQNKQIDVYTYKRAMVKPSKRLSNMAQSLLSSDRIHVNIIAYIAKNDASRVRLAFLYEPTMERIEMFSSGYSLEDKSKLCEVTSTIQLPKGLLESKNVLYAYYLVSEDAEKTEIVFENLFLHYKQIRILNISTERKAQMFHMITLYQYDGIISFGSESNEQEEFCKEMFDSTISINELKVTNFVQNTYFFIERFERIYECLCMCDEINQKLFTEIFVAKMLVRFNEIKENNNKDLYEYLMLTLFFYFNNLFQFDKFWHESVKFSEDCLKLLQSFNSPQYFYELPKLVDAHSSHIEETFSEYINKTKCQTSLQALLLLYSLKYQIIQGDTKSQVKNEIIQLTSFLRNNDFHLNLGNIEELKEYYELFEVIPNLGAICLHFFTRFDEALLLRLLENNIIPIESLISYAIYLTDHEKTTHTNFLSAFRVIKEIVKSAIDIESQRNSITDNNQLKIMSNESKQRRATELLKRASKQDSSLCSVDVVTQIRELAKSVGCDLSIPKEDIISAQIKIGGHEFKELVGNNNIFVDKSLLIKEFVKSSFQVLLITCPRRWGKTINMNMIKTFLEIHVDENGEKIPKTETSSYELFHRKVLGNENANKLKVADDKEFVREHLGEYPVIHIDFKDAKGNNYQTIVERLKRAIFEAYERHEYIISSLDKVSKNKNASPTKKEKAQQHLNEFRKYYNNKGRDITERDIESSLKSLCNILHSHFNKKVYVLMDEYDSIINSLLHNTNLNDSSLKETISLFGTFMSKTFKGNHHLEKGFITGILRIAKSSIFSDVNNLKEYNFLNNKFAKYYGFTEDEVKLLFKEFKIAEEDQQKATKWYDGYRVSIDPSLKLFNTWSIVNFLESKKIENYWEQSGSIDFIKNLFKIQKIKAKVQTLLCQDTAVNLNGLKFTKDDFIKLKMLLNAGDNYVIEDATVDLFFSYIFAAGYLTINEHLTVNDEDYDYESNTFVKLPNYEVKSEIKKQLVQYYKVVYNIDSELFNEVTCELKKLVNNTKQETKNLELSLQKLFQAFPDFINIKQDLKDGFHGNEDLIHSVLNYTALRLNGISKFGTEVWYKNEARADIIVISDTFETGMIIELKYNSSASDALKQAEKYIRIFENYKSIKLIKCLGIAITQGKTVHIESSTKPNPFFLNVTQKII